MFSSETHTSFHKEGPLFSSKLHCQKDAHTKWYESHVPEIHKYGECGHQQYGRFFFVAVKLNSHM